MLTKTVDVSEAQTQWVNQANVAGRCLERNMTEIAIPRPISEAAERLAHKMGISLSELYTAALSAYVTVYQKSSITELLDQIYDTEPSAMDTELVNLQLLAVGKEAW